MRSQPTPYRIHIWVCVNRREDGSKACGNELQMRLKDALKAAVEARGWKGRVRVSHSGCMGLCAQGPNVMVHPLGRWYSGVTEADVPAILDDVAPQLD
ncbi:MAG: (2Fe-2S) ferredoxin domain-containing protein [Kiritimatiellae bacterium]|nr:(2Fe-2S) ferredoxin domain-containing protein [Kiritimatiellia bacterium]